MSNSARAAAVVFVCLAIGSPLASWAGLAPDVDSDGVPDVLDKCMLDPGNVGLQSCDTDCDGYGNRCDGDFNNNGTTNTQDFTMYFVPSLNTGFPSPQGTDMNCNGTVGSQDFTMFFAPKLVTGAGGGPSGLACAGQPGCGC